MVLSQVGFVQGVQKLVADYLTYMASRGTVLEGCILHGFPNKSRQEKNSYEGRVFLSQTFFKKKVLHQFFEVIWSDKTTTIKLLEMRSILLEHHWNFLKTPGNLP